MKKIAQLTKNTLRELYKILEQKHKNHFLKGISVYWLLINSSNQFHGIRNREQIINTQIRVTERKNFPK